MVPSSPLQDRQQVVSGFGEFYSVPLPLRFLDLAGAVLIIALLWVYLGLLEYWELKLALPLFNCHSSFANQMLARNLF